jgi:hypothetical protein
MAPSIKKLFDSKHKKKPCVAKLSLAEVVLKSFFPKYVVRHLDDISDKLVV